MSELLEQFETTSQSDKKKINSMKAAQIRGMALTMESFSCNGYQQFVLTLKSSLTHLSCEK